jgi:hypothetical protein
MRVKQVEDLAALRALVGIYRKLEDLRVIYTRKTRIEAYDSAGKLRHVAEAEASS